MRCVCRPGRLTSFAATSERKGSGISHQIANALIENGLKVFLVTHLHEFARSMHQRQMRGAIFLRAERREDGTRTFRLHEGEPPREPADSRYRRWMLVRIRHQRS